MERERDIEKWLRKKIEEMGGQFIKFTSPGNDGVPDRIALMPGGRIWFVELKTSTGTTTAIQDWQIGRLKKLGFAAIVVKGMSDARAFADVLKDEQDGFLGGAD